VPQRTDRSASDSRSISLATCYNPLRHIGIRLLLSQERFLLRSTNSISHPEALWWVPITYTSEKQLNFNDTQPLKWMKAERSITLNDLDISSSQWLIFNIQETGNYSEK